MKNWTKVFLLFLIAGSLVYFNSMNNKFLIDDYIFLNNPVMSSTKFISLQWNPYQQQALGVLDAHDTPNYYRPMTHIVYDLSYGTFKNNFWQYHLLNLFLFVLASSLIYLLVERISGNSTLALLAGFFYLIHPINGVIVNYISASVFALQVIFVLGTILLLWESLERNNGRVLYLMSLIFCFFSLFWHEMGAMVPFYVSAVILLCRKEPFKQKAAYLFPYFLIVLSYIVFRFCFLSIVNPILKTPVLTGWEYLANLSHVIMWYISRLFYPQGIVLNWVAPILHDHITGYAWGMCLLLVLSILFFVRFSKEKIPQMALAWILIGFFPVCLSAFIRSDVGVQIEPHWFIISSIGFFILAAYCCTAILDRAPRTGLAVIFILIFGWGVISHANNRLWADQKTYALYWLQEVPGLKLAYKSLGDEYQREGAFKESEKYYKLSLAGDSSDATIYYNLGLLDQKEGDLKGAESNYKTALFIYPHMAGVYNNLGLLYSVQGRFEEAKESFVRSLMINPMLLKPRLGLASIALKHSEYQQAIHLCLRNLETVNDDPETLLFMIDIFIQKKDAVNIKKYALRIANSGADPKTLTRLGILMMQNDYPMIALDCFEKAIHEASDYTDAYLAAGTLFANLGKYDQAIHLWETASSIDPSDYRFKANIAKVKALMPQ